MKNIISIIAAILIQLSLTYCQNNQKEFPVLKGPYFGQKSPGTTPEVFMPEIFRMYNQIHGRLVFTPDGNEATWVITSMGHKKIVLKQNTDGSWLPPAPAILSDSFTEHEPFYSRDGKRLYYQSRAPLNGAGANKDIDIWYRERNKQGWGNPQNIGAPVNSDEDDCQPWIGSDGTLYLTRFNKNLVKGMSGEGDIYYSNFIDGKYKDPIMLGPEINSEYEELHSVISPDNSYLLFTSNRPGEFSKEFNLFVSFRKSDGGWSKAKCISNDWKIEYIWAPTLSSDGKYLFFSGGFPGKKFNESNNYYWVNTSFLQQLKQKELKSN